jgi:sirohydrochlorin cobaltochelatase
MYLRKLSLLGLLLSFLTVSTAQERGPSNDVRLPVKSTGCALLVIAHGAKTAGWNDRVVRTVNQVEWAGPKGVAFLTPSSSDESLPKVVARLDQPGVDRIVVVPLLVSSYSGHYEEIRYYTGERKDPPEDVEDTPLKTHAALRLTKGMDDDPLLSRILLDQVRTVSTNPSAESVVLVAHGPNSDSDNERWLACLQAHAAFLQQTGGFRRVEFLTLRDDAPKAVRDAATAALRENVKTASADSTVLIAPVLISVGHVQAEIEKRLEGLTFKMATGGVSGHPLTPEWIRERAERASTIH